MTKQLPTLKNLKMWGCSPADLCSRCGITQSNKHILSNCNSPEALSRYLDRHNQIRKLIAGWILSGQSGGGTLYCDLSVSGASHISDLFIGFRPDLAIVFPSRIMVGELTICHETNLITSRDYKINKYSKLSHARSIAFISHTVSVHTFEISSLGFVVTEPDFFKLAKIPIFSPTSELFKTVILASRNIYCNR
jgi:hypothetical protein